MPALALAVALIAVPMALSSSATPTPTAPATAPAASEPGEETAAEPAVLTRQLGVTAYRKRLERFNGKNPFQQQFTLPEVTSKVEQSSVTEPLGPRRGHDIRRRIDLDVLDGRANLGVEHLARCQHAPRPPPPSLRATPRSRPCT